ncbi:hypothetical protein LDENG_00017780 [Lucifuga dentata]|nr:hypothetical protein LDENG_00017780 [Lucifuga dentata]
MAVNLQGFALEKAELLSNRVKELLSSGQDYVWTQFGVNLGLKPELYPTWVILSTAAVGLLLLLAVSWAVLCGGVLAGKKRGLPVNQCSGEPGKAHFTKTTKAEEQKKRNKKKPSEKKTQSNGQPVTAAEDDVKVTEVVSKQSSDMRTNKVHEVQSTVQVKKNKKKTKSDVKPVQTASTNDGKEPDDGAWETKVSNREKRQQRRKDKGPEESGTTGGMEAPKSNVQVPVFPAPTNVKKNRGNHDSQHSQTSGKGDHVGGAVSSSWREEPSVNGGGWTDMSLKISSQMGTMEGSKWTAMPTAPHYRAKPEPQSWAQETQATWSTTDGRMKTDLNPVSFSMLGIHTTEPTSNSADLQWGSHPDIDDEWSGFNGTAAVDPSSDWNAPAEPWGNYEEASVLETPAPPLKEQPVPNKVSEDENETEDPVGGAAKSKKKKKKKKNTEEEAASVAQAVRSVPLINTTPKSQELPMPTSNKQNPSMPSSQKRAEQTAEPPRPSQKKKARKET